MPSQARGEHRVDRLLTAAVEEFAAAGYDAATMSGIAKRAGSPIGSLYQFFPDKPAVARALRTRHAQHVEAALLEIETSSVDEFVTRFVDAMAGFVDTHPAFLPLLDAPSSTKPVEPRHRVSLVISAKVAWVVPHSDRAAQEQLGELVLELNRGVMGMYARKRGAQRDWVLESFRTLLKALLARAAADASNKPTMSRKRAVTRSSTRAKARGTNRN